MAERRSAMALGAALAAHALVLTLAVRTPHKPVVNAVVPPSSLEIELTEEKAARGGEPATGGPAIAHAASSRGRETPRGERAASPAAGDALVTSNEPAAPGASDTWRAPVERAPSLEQMGLAGANRFLREAPPPTTLETRRDDILSAPLQADDAARGLGPEGPALRNLEEEAYSSAVPRNGHATFELRVGADGKVLGFALIDSNGDRGLWSEIATRTAKSLEGTTLRPPARKRPMALRIALDSRIAMPSGADPGVDVHIAGIPVSRGEGDRSTKVDLLNPFKPGNIVTVLGDLSDVGARPRTVVHAHVVDQREL